jgi:diguanylate cyclase (GGDEF)-like protein
VVTTANGRVDDATTDVAPELRIVLVEDSPSDARLTAELLRDTQRSAHVSTFSCVEDAVAALAVRRADCVLLDLGLPDAEELEGLARILAVTDATPIVLLTGRDDDRLALEAVRFGAQDYLTKRELTTSALWRTISRAIERSRLAHERQRAALQDTLTGLPDRVLFDDRVTRTMARSRRSGIPFAVAFIDVDGFKAINDVHGHVAGNHALREIARRLLDGLRGEDAASRFGGDEFVVVCENASGYDAATRIGARLHHAITSRPLSIDGQDLEIAVSVGVTLGSGDDTSVAELLRRADRAMYRAKAARSRVALYRPEFA